MATGRRDRQSIGFRSTSLIGITDGTANHDGGHQAIATNIYNNRGCSNFTM